MKERRDIKKPTAAFRRFAKAPANFGAKFDRSNLRITELGTELLAVGPCL